ncbi:hypothetical protein C8T65DRAFT_636191 [Cerioporus squamosus]|nr:hypothetical protein C8T65DRAFT_636191 [Cerioporus squamosus]
MLEPTSFYHLGAIRAGGPSPLTNRTDKIPMDVEEHVIPSLRNCALARREWRPRSRHHLILSIQVRTRDNFASLCDFFDKHQNLASLVEAWNISPSTEEPNPRSLVEVVLVGLLRQLPNLRQYTLLLLSASDTLRGLPSSISHSLALRDLRPCRDTTLRTAQTLEV